MKNINNAQDLVNQSAILLNENRTTLKDIFYYIVQEHATNVAFLYHRADDTIISYTYQDFAHQVNSIAKKLATLLKEKKKGSVVALKMHNAPYWCFLFYAILMAGFKVLLIDAKLQKDNTINLLKNARATAIISDDGFKYEIPSLNKKEIEKTLENPNFIENWENEVIFCSSGTTGDIKLVIYNGLNLLHQLNAARDMIKTSKDIIYSVKEAPLRIMCLIPLHHIFGFTANFFWYTFFGSILVFTKVSEPLALINDIRRLKITHLYHVPLFFDVVYKNFFNKLNEKEREKVAKVIENNLLKKKSLLNLIITNKIKEKIFGKEIRYLISGGGYLSEETSRAFNGLGYPLYNGYGMSEVGVTSVELSSDVIDRLKRSIGCALYGVSYKLSVEKELLIKSPITHLKEIVNGEIKNTILDSEGYFKTGDIATIDDDNRCYILGRIKDTMIASNGENVYPDEIESYFHKINSVNNLAAFMVNNRIVMVINGDINLKDSCLAINKTLPIHKQVNDFVFTPNPLPLSSSGKVKRFLVKEMYQKGEYNVSKKEVIDILKDYDAEKKNQVITQLNNVYKKVLFVKQDVDPNGHWINDLHSDSMTYITLISEIEKEFKIKIPIEKYGKLTTLNEFAKDILDSNCK